MKTTFLAIGAAATLLLPVAPAMAGSSVAKPAYSSDASDGAFGFQRGRARYDRNGRYIEPRQIRDGDRVWQDDQGRYRCRRENGTTGLIIGAAGGALAGRAIDSRGDRTVGTLLGAAAGAVLGREIQRSGGRCR
jgi:hypothetical protein